MWSSRIVRGNTRPARSKSRSRRLSTKLRDSSMIYPSTSVAISCSCRSQVFRLRSGPIDESNPGSRLRVPSARGSVSVVGRGLAEVRRRTGGHDVLGSLARTRDDLAHGAGRAVRGVELTGGVEGVLQLGFKKCEFSLPGADVIELGGEEICNVLAGHLSRLSEGDDAADIRERQPSGLRRADES